jgi:hypothetical protein
MQLVTVQECLTFFISVPSSYISGSSDRAAVGGTAMNPVMTLRQGRKGEASQVAAKAPLGLNTRLYDVMTALQSGVEPAEDDLVVAIIVRCLRARRLTLVGDVTVAA